MVYICAIKPGMGAETDKREIQKALKPACNGVKKNKVFFNRRLEIKRQGKTI